MNITSFDNIVVSIPLKQPVKISHNTYTTREFNILLIHTNEGVTGVSYARGGAIVHAAIEELGQLLIGEDPMMYILTSKSNNFVDKVYDKAINVFELTVTNNYIKNNELYVSPSIIRDCYPHIKLL